MNYIDNFNFWKNDEFFDGETRKELSALDPSKDEKEIEDRFYKDLEFGTGGLRGVMGAGTNRMNKYTVGKATKGLANYLIDTFGQEAAKEKGVVIAFDTRNNSARFAKITAAVLSAMGIKALLFKEARPTPELSFAVRFYNTLAGVVVTASHNPKEYNGYKVCDEYGDQLCPDKAEAVIKYVNAVSDFKTIDFEENKSLVEECDPTDDFIKAVLKQSRINNEEEKKKIKIIYTPLHGTGKIPVMKVLEKSGFTDVVVVPKQAVADGNFPTVVSPNPEDRRALELGIELAKKEDADLVLGTDPDSDRVGVCVKTKDGYKLITGNQMGALLVDFVLNSTNLETINKPAVVKTEVTSELGALIAKKHGAYIFSTLTGFKYIGEKITQFEAAKKEGTAERDFDFLIGYEESYGYLVGTHARDKDAVVSSLLICEMTAKLKSEGKTLVDRLDEIYNEFGFYKDALDSFTLKGKDGIERIQGIMADLRQNENVFENIEKIIDYKKDVKAEEGFGLLPKSNVLKYFFKNGNWIAVRPSGTEPKIKIYYSIKSDNEENAEKSLEETRKLVIEKLGLN